MNDIQGCNKLTMAMARENVEINQDNWFDKIDKK
jgi:hypothetical protein